MIASGFPGTGRKLSVDFVAFKVILWFENATTLTYYSYGSDGNVAERETVSIRTEPLTDTIHLVTWQEPDKTTVVHVEDLGNQTIITSIISPDLEFSQYHGTFVEQSEPELAELGVGLALSYTRDIRPMFRDGDISCMRRRGVLLGDPGWMCTPANAERVYNALSSEIMPPDQPWPTDRIAKVKAWMDGGCNP